MSETSEQEPWQWPEEIWRGHVDAVRAGRRLVPEWPDGANVAVALSFDSDHETIPLRDGETRPGKLSAGEYGSRVAVPKILSMLREFKIPASFYIPAVSALLHPQEVTSYVEDDHEVGVHGWIHERNVLLSRDAEFDLMGRCIEVLHRLGGQRPVGMRTPSWDFSDHTVAALLEFGFQYDSSLMADDEPYEIVANGRPTGLVEIPVEWIRDDAPYFMFDRYTSLRPHMPPRSALQIWIDEFDAAYAEGGLFQLTMHPHIIGHRSRLTVLRKLLEHITQHSGVWYATHAQVAERCAALLDTSSHNDRGESS